MAFPWMLALKVIPWGDVIEHAPKVLNGARKLLDKQKASPEPTTSTSVQIPETEALRLLQQSQQQLRHDLAQLTQMTTELAEQNSRLVQAVDVLRWRTRWLAGVCALLLGGLVALAWLG